MLASTTKRAASILPLEDLRRFNVTQREIADNQNTPAFCEMMKFEVERARDWFRQGLPLIKKVDSELAVDLDLFSRGGQEILNAIEQQDYAVLGNRPSISKPRKLALVARAATAKLLDRLNEFWEENRESNGESNHERGHAAGSGSLDAGSAAARHGVFRLQRHHPQGGEKLLLRIPGSAAPQARGAVCRLRLHAALR